MTGAVLADVGLGRRTRYATATLLIGANLPDVDVLAYVHSSDAALGFRRGWTHGVLALAVLPVLLALAVVAWDRLRRRGGEPVRPGVILGLAYLAVWSHPFLDWLNNYGVRLLMPFRGTWFYGDAIFIVDPWLWLVLGGTLFLSHSASRRERLNWGALAFVLTALVFLGTRVPAGGRVGVVPRSWPLGLWLFGLAVLVVLRFCRDGGGDAARRRARRALTVAGFYVFAMVVSTAAVSRELRATLARDGGTGRFMVAPVPFDPLERTLVVETEDAYRFASHHWLAVERLRFEERTMPRGAAAPAAAAALQASCVRGFVTWVRFPFFDARETEDGWEVYLLDARYVRRRTTGFGGARVVLDGELRARCDGSP